MARGRHPKSYLRITLIRQIITWPISVTLIHVSCHSSKKYDLYRLNTPQNNWKNISRHDTVNDIKYQLLRQDLEEQKKIKREKSFLSESSSSNPKFWVSEESRGHRFSRPKVLLEFMNKSQSAKNCFIVLMHWHLLNFLLLTPSGQKQGV